MASLKRKIDHFKPDYIYMTVRNIYKWLPDITTIKNVCKVFVECDSFNYDYSSQWYKQFDKVYCRQAWWEEEKTDTNLGMPIDLFTKRKKNALSWGSVPLFRWSICEKDIIRLNKKRSGIYFIGKWDSSLYPIRKKMHKLFRHEVKFFPRKNHSFIRGKPYWNLLYKSAALICPSESIYGGFIPAKIFEYAASGSAVITNCNLKRYGMEDLDGAVIKYNDLNDLKEKICIDFSTYYMKAAEIIRNHTHIKRYQEIFE